MMMVMMVMVMMMVMMVMVMMMVMMVMVMMMVMMVQDLLHTSHPSPSGSPETLENIDWSGETYTLHTTTQL